MKKILFVFGTRPEAIKMCPLVQECLSRKSFSTAVCVTGQHREMLDSVLNTFGITPTYDLSVMKQGQSLFELTERILHGMERVLTQAAPSLVLVHGDTATAFASALASFYLHIPVGHVEAGLRTHDVRAPFPEEFYRTAIAKLSAWDFAPTEHAKENLLRENKAPDRIFVTGNTVLDALRFTVRKTFSHPLLDWCGKHKLMLLTAHRRENLGTPMRRAFRAVRAVLTAHEGVKLICPLHKNPAVRQIAQEELGGMARVRLIEPPDVLTFHNLLARCHLVLTDSGGIQEEGAALGKPVLILRNTTERPEGILAGTSALIGTDEETIKHTLSHLLEDENALRTMTKAENPYGDGSPSRRIANILENQ